MFLCVTGEPGFNGTHGHRGKRGKHGEAGQKGEPGMSGLRGPKGDMGEPGLDASSSNCTCKCMIYEGNVDTIYGLISFLLVSE